MSYLLSEETVTDENECRIFSFQTEASARNITERGRSDTNPLSNVVFPYFVIQEYRKRYTLFENKLVSD